MSTTALIQRVREAGVELRLVDGKLKLIGRRAAVETLVEPLRQYKADLVRWFTAANDRVPASDRADWIELDQAYQAHHFNCAHCQAAGRGARYGLRCGVGAALWGAYSEKA